MVWNKKLSFKKAKDWGWTSVETIFNKLKIIYSNYDEDRKKLILKIQLLSKELYIKSSSLMMFYNGFAHVNRSIFVQPFILFGL